MMLKNITFSAEDDLVERARQKAQAQKSTLNEEFRRWLSAYTGKEISREGYDAMFDEMSYVRAGGRFSRDKMNER